MVKARVLFAFLIVSVAGCSYNPLDNKPNTENVSVASVGDASTSTWVGSWKVVFHTLQGLDFASDVDNINVEVAEFLSGTHATFVGVKEAVYYYKAERTTLYVRTQEEKNSWDDYLQRQREEKRLATSPRDVAPPVKKEMEMEDLPR